MSSSLEAPLSSRQRAALETLVTDLERVFGTRLRSVVAYGLEVASTDGELRTLAMLDGLSADDLHQLAPTIRSWQRLGLAVPLLLTPHEFLRTLDVFPLEYGNIIDTHVVVRGQNPFANVQVPESDRRRGCELEAKSHLIHLREGFLEAEGNASQVSRLIVRSAPAFRTILSNIIRLERGSDPAPRLDDHELAAAAEGIMGVPAALVIEVLSSASGLSAAADPAALFARYVESSERVWHYVDGWRS